MNSLMTATEPTTPHRRLRWLKRVALALLMVIVSAAGTVALLFYLAQREMAEAVAEADRLDPGWRFEDLERKRAAIADEDNAAMRVMAAHRLMPNGWPNWGNLPPLEQAVLETGPSEAPPTTPLTAQQVEALNRVWADAVAAIAEVRKLKDLPTGRYAMAPGPDGVPTSHPSYPAVHPLARLLSFDVLLRAHDHDIDAALESCRAIVNLARSFGDEPTSFSQCARLEIRAIACRMIERALAQGQASEASLATLQMLLEDEETHPAFLHGARGMRAWFELTFDAAGEGKVKQQQIPSWMLSSVAANVRPSTLRMSTRLVEIAKLAVEEQAEPLKHGGIPVADDGPYLSRALIVPKIQKIAVDLSRRQIRTQAELRCTIAGLAAERYRLANDHWPASLAALVPAYLRVVPVDPFDSQRVRFRPLPDGVVIYCVGLDRVDNLGTLDRGVAAPVGTDFGIQLWNAKDRGQVDP